MQRALSGGVRGPGERDVEALVVDDDVLVDDLPASGREQTSERGRDIEPGKPDRAGLLCSANPACEKGGFRAQARARRGSSRA